MTAFFDLPVRRIQGDGIEIAARIDGSGPPLLLLHGHPQTHAIWHRVWPELTRHRTCVAAAAWDPYVIWPGPSIGSPSSVSSRARSAVRADRAASRSTLGSIG